MGRKKHKVEEEEKLERWLVSYADFITLLFAFFTVMYATSQADSAKYKQTAEAIQRAFLSSGGIFPLKGSPFSPFEKPPDKGSVVPPSPKDQGKHSKIDDAALDKVKENVQGIFEKSTGVLPTDGDLEIFRSEKGYKIRIGEHVLYRPGSDRIKRENVAFLYEVGKRLARMGVALQVEGHTDNREPASGGSNWQLSLSRSHNVVRFLVEGAGFPKDRISIAGFGDTQPISDNTTPDGRARNRRIELSIVTADANVTDLVW